MKSLNSLECHSNLQERFRKDYSRAVFHLTGPSAIMIVEDVRCCLQCLCDFKYGPRFIGLSVAAQ